MAVPFTFPVANAADGPPKTLPVVVRREAPCQVRPEEPEGIGPGPPRDRLQAELESGEILEPAMAGDRVAELDADEVDQA